MSIQSAREAIDILVSHHITKEVKPGTVHKGVDVVIYTILRVDASELSRGEERLYCDAWEYLYEVNASL